jgi:hypothetical protein
MRSAGLSNSINLPWLSVIETGSVEVVVESCAQLSEMAALSDTSSAELTVVVPHAESVSAVMPTQATEARRLRVFMYGPFRNG